MSTSSNSNNAVLEPHLNDIDRGSGSARYPNPFFDLGQQYIPRTIKELFKWCTYFYYTNPLVGATITKISRYPITDMILEDPDSKVVKGWKYIFNDLIHIKDRHMEVNLDLNVYGNAFVSIHLPFTRFLICQSCNTRTSIKDLAWTWRSFKFAYKCPSCGSSEEANPEDKKTIKDVPFRSREDIKIVRWNPENMAIRYNEATGSTNYFYNMSPTLRHQINSGERDIIEELPLLFLLAVKKSRLIKMSNSNLFHLKRPTLAEKDVGWGKPLIQHVLKDLYYMATLRRAQEAIAQEHIVPFDFLFPQPNAQMDPFVHTDLGNWKNRVEEIVKNRRRDPNYKAVMPVPIGFGRLGGQGKALMLTPELNMLSQQIVGGMGIPSEFLFGGLNWCVASYHRVFTSLGLLKMEEICPEEIGFREESKIHVATKEHVQPIALVHRTEKKIQHTIKTRIGLNLTGSKIHRLWVLNKDLRMDWKCLQDIRVGDKVAFPKKVDLWGPKKPSNELCRILGYLVSEGSVTEKSLAFTNTNIVVMEDFLSCLYKEFGIRLHHTTRTFNEDSNHYGLKPLHDIQIHDYKTARYLKEIIGLGYSKDKKVPRLIRESKKECVFEFLKALFEGDGCNYVSPANKQTISYASISKELLDDVQLLLLNAGIVSYQYPEYCDVEGERVNVPCLHIRSGNAQKFLDEIGFVTKNDRDISNCNPEQFRCEYEKIPYLLELLKDLKKKTKGCGAWIKDPSTFNLSKDYYTTKEVADILGRDRSSVQLYIKNGKIKAEKEKRTDGRYPTYIIQQVDLRSFLDKHGVQKRASVGQTTWEINENNADHVNWDGVKELDPALYERYQELKKAGFLWDEVIEKKESLEKIEMCDLTVHNTHSYIVGGLVSHNTGSSITLRSLQNDFQHNQTQLLEMTNWIKDKIRIFLRIPDVKTLRFMDFKMADDIQRIQQLISLNAQRKVSDETLLTELGLDYEKETKKIVEEIQVTNQIQDLMARSQAKTSGESQIISWNYQQKIQELTMKAQKKAQEESLNDPNMLPPPMPGGPEQEGAMAGEQSGLQPQSEDPGEAAHSQMTAQQAVQMPGYQDQTGQEIPGSGPTTSGGGQNNYLDVHKMIKTWASKLINMESGDADRMLVQVKQQMPEFGAQVEKALNELKAQAATAGAGGGGTAAQAAPGGAEVDMTPMPEQRAPTRAGSV